MTVTSHNRKTSDYFYHTLACNQQLILTQKKQHSKDGPAENTKGQTHPDRSSFDIWTVCCTAADSRVFTCLSSSSFTRTWNSMLARGGGGIEGTHLTFLLSWYSKTTPLSLCHLRLDYSNPTSLLSTPVHLSFLLTPSYSLGLILCSLPVTCFLAPFLDV